MRLVGCDLHARKQQVAMLDSETGEVQEVELWHHGEDVERFFPQVVSRWAVGATEGGRRPETL